MTDERTPLIAVVDVRPQRDRYAHHTIRFICTTVLSTILFLGIIAVVIILTFFTHDHDTSTPSISAFLPWSARGPPSSWPKTNGIDYADLQDILLTTPDADRAREWSQYYTSGPHLAGKNLSQALWTQQKWQEFGVKNAQIVDYDIYVNYPIGHRLGAAGRE